jgi:hypothetical protein
MQFRVCEFLHISIKRRRIGKLKNKYEEKAKVGKDFHRYFQIFRMNAVLFNQENVVVNWIQSQSGLS